MGAEEVFVEQVLAIDIEQELLDELFVSGETFGLELDIGEESGQSLGNSKGVVLEEMVEEV